METQKSVLNTATGILEDTHVKMDRQLEVKSEDLRDALEGSEGAGVLLGTKPLTAPLGCNWEVPSHR